MKLLLVSTPSTKQVQLLTFLNERIGVESSEISWNSGLVLLSGSSSIIQTVFGEYLFAVDGPKNMYKTVYRPTVTSCTPTATVKRVATKTRFRLCLQ